LRYRLPPWFAIVSAATTITVTISATAASATITTAAAVSAATTAVAVVARPTIGARPRFVHRQVATFEVFPVELFDGRGGFFGRGHFDEAKASRTPGHAVLDYLRRFNVAGLREMFSQIIAGRLEGEVSDIKFCSHFLIYPQS
jgi:hypothetical protein